LILTPARTVVCGYVLVITLELNMDSDKRLVNRPIWRPRLTR